MSVPSKHFEKQRVEEKQIAEGKDTNYVLLRVYLKHFVPVRLFQLDSLT